ncbi:hypothetical protein NC653_030995 [Populus alba x Populus x berolinensis]|uniref:Uncharacterized protein n=1 Tax=Populus alba x Populus x berolinensis TaxID=444605 RepID=A0AAD6Q127_9ROSI|nr:hypothetical protein NC653_030995 [Populus alba x Populus x berolinensis]
MDTLRDLWVSRFWAGSTVVEGGKSSVGVADRTEQRAWCCSGAYRALMDECLHAPPPARLKGEKKESDNPERRSHIQQEDHS